MPIIVTTLLSLLGGLFTPLGDWFRRKQQIQAAAAEAEQRIHLQILKNEGIAAEAEAHNSGERLRATSAMFKYGTFVMWFYPFIIGQIRPSYAKAIFDNLLAMPALYHYHVCYMGYFCQCSSSTNSLF
jgi:hypothetical protein